MLPKNRARLAAHTESYAAENTDTEHFGRMWYVVCMPWQMHDAHMCGVWDISHHDMRPRRALDAGWTTLSISMAMGMGGHVCA
jgi:hypothetical protein